VVAVDPLRHRIEVNATLTIGKGQTGLIPERCLILLADLVVVLYDYISSDIRVASSDLDPTGL
jgi:hypothetical protein